MPADGRAGAARVRVATVLEAFGWLAVAAKLVLTATQLFGIQGNQYVAGLQSLTPYVLLPSLPVAAAASLCRRHALALGAATMNIVLLVLSFPVVFPPTVPHIGADAPRLTVAHANLAYFNVVQSPGAVRAMLAANADVLEISEFTVRHRQSLIDVGAESR